MDAEPHTPARPTADNETADFTRPQDPQPPTKLHAAKKRSIYGIVPPPVNKGRSVHETTVAAEMRSYADELDRQARNRREVYETVAAKMDNLYTCDPLGVKYNNNNNNNTNYGVRSPRAIFFISWRCSGFLKCSTRLSIFAATVS
ncbi:uncharacterized protein N7515_002194 [Penicillium bovifimosum]|uniref:Uncharacterized protein n=1 Tax=Penicillium bovifimosum TaxID=126998 RepID=A0A9W9HB47_9EURO|nr:uncharacterized protein N7515_002194 [Penicillium bovifimosum]KAJ5143407.1 hypothetical protein N7515_002194 [Penicillium bovifimosum]